MHVCLSLWSLDKFNQFRDDLCHPPPPYQYQHFVVLKEENAMLFVKSWMSLNRCPLRL